MQREPSQLGANLEVLQAGASRGHWKYDRATGKLVEYDPHARAPEVDAPTIVNTDVPMGVQSMATGKWYTCKRRLREEYRSMGKEEVGDDVNWRPTRDPSDVRREQEALEADISKAYYQARDGNAPLSELDKERCKIIDRNLENYNYDRRK